MSDFKSVSVSSLDREKVAWLWRGAQAAAEKPSAVTPVTLHDPSVWMGGISPNVQMPVKEDCAG